MKYTILNREFQPSQDGIFHQGCLIHLVPLGDFPGVMTLNGEEIKVTQRFDAASHQAIVRNFLPKVLVDFEHRSMSADGDTTAAAWIPSLQNRADGLWCPLEFSDVGEAAVKNKRIRFLSPAFDVEMIDQENKIVRPTRLISVGLTNRPNLKSLTPLTNREPDGAHNANAATAANAEEETMKGIIALLGLKEGSDEATVLNSVKELLTAKTDLTVATAKVKELEGIVLNKEADEFVVKHAGRIKNKDAVKAQFVKNKADTITTFEALADLPAVALGTKGSATVHNRAGAQTPAGTGTVVNKATEQATFIQQVRNREKCGYKAAFNMARTEKPELFKEETKED